MSPDHSPYRFPIVAALLLLALLALHALHFHPFISDDALISLRYSDRLLAGHGLTWNDGERVEGYSNLLWVLAAAGLGGLLRGLGVGMVETLRILGFLGMGGALCAILYLYRSSISFRRPLSLAAPLLFLLSAPIAVWTIGGLEQPFVAAFLAWGIVLLLPLLDRDDLVPRALLLPGLFLALLAVTRPDGLLFTAAAVLALAVARRRIDRRTLLLAGSLLLLPAIFYAAQLLFRLAYYGEWVPNTALVKVGLSPHRMMEGARYLLRGMLPLLPAIVPIALMLPRALRDPGRRQRIVLLLLLAVVWLLYVIVIGGDIFPAGRHLVPFVLLLALLAGECVATLIGHPVARRHRWLAAGLLLAFVALQFADRQNRRAMTERWEWDGLPIGLGLKRAFPGRRPLLAVDAAGALPYWSELPAVDMLGLNDYYLPRHRPADFGAGEVGHELGDGRYVLGRNPDLVVFGPPRGNDTAGFRSGVEMQRDAAFRERYLLVLIAMPADSGSVTAHIWMRRTGGSVGISYGGESAVIPGWLAEPGAAGRSDAILLDSGGLATRIRERRQVTGLALPPGSWRIEQETIGTSRCAVAFTGPMGEPIAGISDRGLPAGISIPGSAQIVMTATASVGIVIDPPPGGEVLLRRLVLQRVRG